MKDIADRGNVSVATVSQVLRDRGAERYSQSTRDKIMRVARELGWSPNRLVRGIQTGRSGMAGAVMVPSGEYWQRLAVGLQTHLLACDLVPLILQPDYDGGTKVTELELLRNFMGLRVEGLVCWPLTERAAVDYLADVCAKQVPVVTLDFELAVASAAIEVRTREPKAMGVALDHLMELGHRKIGYVGFATPGNWVVDRRNAFVHETAARGLEAVFIKEIAKGENPGQAKLEECLRQVTAVVAATEHLAVSVWHIAEKAKLHIPRDLSMVGFGHFHFDFALWPKFTSIDQHPEKIGRVAATLLMDSAARDAARREAAANGPEALPHVEVEPSLVLGQTTAPPFGR